MWQNGNDNIKKYSENSNYYPIRYTSEIVTIPIIIFDSPGKPGP